MPVQQELNRNAKNGVKPVKIYTRDIEHSALSQLKNLSQLPIVHSHIAAMPDVHAGVGATVGAVIALKAEKKVMVFFITFKNWNLTNGYAYFKGSAGMFAR